MSDQLDRRIRELYAELTEATPPLPPLPERAPAGRWLRRLPAMTLAAAAAVAAVVTTAGVLSVMARTDDAGDAAAPTTTSAATTTSAPTTTSGAADTTGAPGTVTTLAPVDALSLQCEAFGDAARVVLEGADANAGSYEAALDVLEGELFGLRSVVIDLSDDDRTAANEALDALALVIADARGGFAVVTEELDAVDAELTNVGSVLADLGAGECTVLADLLP